VLAVVALAWVGYTVVAWMGGGIVVEAVCCGGTVAVVEAVDWMGGGIVVEAIRGGGGIVEAIAVVWKGWCCCRSCGMNGR
jgi:hypothetical protein